MNAGHVNGWHLDRLSTSSEQHHPPLAVAINGSSINYSTAPNLSARDCNELQAFITKIRDDAIICGAIKQRKSRWLEVRIKWKYRKVVIFTIEHLYSPSV